jgi:ABC-type glycerol-3-phosphate transport system substrate-binding protein
MKRLWIAGLAAAGVMAGTSAMAQDEAPAGSMQKQTTTTTTTWTVNPEERTVIRDYVVKEKVRPERIKEEISVGIPVPTDVELQPVPQEIYEKVPEAQHYQYFDWNGRVVFVDPASRKVVQIVD